MQRRIVRHVVGGAIALALLAGSVARPSSAAALEGNAVTRWVQQSLQAVRKQNVGTPDAGRLYAMVTVAMYDAVNGIDSARGHGRQPALVGSDGAPAEGHSGAAAASAAHLVLSNLTPSQQSVLDAALFAELEDAGGADDPAVSSGAEWGRSVGNRVVSIRSTDGTQLADPIPAGTGPGVHRASFDARFRHMTPFGIESKAPYGSGPPPALTSREYAAAFNEVKALGRPDGNAERNQISSFWLAEGGTVRETGTWVQASLAIVVQEGTIESLPDTARLFALVGMAIADAVLVSWETKATYFSWRPTVAIREADTDGNADTEKDPSWVSRIGSVGGSPEYNSGTSTFAGAASAVIERFYSDTHLNFCFVTDKATHGPRCYSSTLEGAKEAGRSRIYQGIHFQFANEDGRRAGRLLGREIATTRLCRTDTGTGSGSDPCR